MHRSTQQRKTNVAVIWVALSLVFVMCWGTQFNMLSGCSHKAHADTAIELGANQVTNSEVDESCELTSKLLQANQLDLSTLAVLLIFVWLIMPNPPTRQRQFRSLITPKPKRRPHKLKCVFLE